jgi:ABC-type multidrug transport system ATPase subunit
MTSYLQFDSVEKSYGRVAALSGVDLSVDRGGIVALLGPNGAGKSTLFGCLLGFIRPGAGSITLRGRPLTDADRSRFGYVSERVTLYPHGSVLENGAYFARLRGHDSSELELQLERVGLYGARDRKVRQLSKGMLQRLGLAIALCGQPDLLVLDEPFNGLDPSLLDELREILRSENDRGATLLIATHTMSAIEPLATHVAILLNGKFAASGTLDDLREQHGYADSLETIYHRVSRSRRSLFDEEACV